MIYSLITDIGSLALVAVVIVTSGLALLKQPKE